MLKKLLILLAITFFVFIGAPNTFADIGVGVDCKVGGEKCVDGYSCQPDAKRPSTFSCQPDSGIGVGVDCQVDGPKCVNGYSCQPDAKRPSTFSCQPDTVGNVFGKVEPPPPLKTFLQKDPTGTGAISQFLSNFVTLLFSIAAIALIFMILWGAFEWLTSGGDKEKLSAAQRRMINAFIGIILFAVAFAIIRVLGTFTGFKLFSTQNISYIDRDAKGNITGIKCVDGRYFAYPKTTNDCDTPLK